MRWTVPRTILLMCTPPGRRTSPESSRWSRSVRRKRTAATSSSTPSAKRERMVTVEPAPLGSDAARVGCLRHPPPGPHLPPTCRVLSPRSDETRRLPDRGPPRVLRHRGLREQVALLRARRPAAGGRGKPAHAHRSGTWDLRGGPLFRGSLRYSCGNERGAYPQPHRSVGRPLHGARLSGLRGLRLYLREQR